MKMLPILLFLIASGISISFDKDIYSPGEKVTIYLSGPRNTVVGVEVRSPSNGIVAIREIRLNGSGRGVFSFMLSNNSEEGVYRVYVAGRGLYSSASFNVYKVFGVNISLSFPDLFVVGKVYNLSGFLNPPASGTVSIHVRSDGKWNFLGNYSVVDGSFHFVFSPSKKGFYDIKVFYNGSVRYNPSVKIFRVRVYSEEEASSLIRCVVPVDKLLVGSNVTVICEYCQGFKLYGPGLEKIVNGSFFLFNATVPGLWKIIPFKDGFMGHGCVIDVLAPTSLNISVSYSEVGLSFPVMIRVNVSPSVPDIPITYYVVKDGTVVQVLENRTVFSRSAQDVVVIETKIKRECVYYAGSPINYLEIIAIFRSDVMMNLLLTRDSISPCEEKSFGGGYSVRPCDPLGVYDVEVYVWNGFPSEMGSSFAILAESKHAQFTVNP